MLNPFYPRTHHKLRQYDTFLHFANSKHTHSPLTAYSQMEFMTLIAHIKVYNFQLKSEPNRRHTFYHLHAYNTF